MVLGCARRLVRHLDHAASLAAVMPAATCEGPGCCADRDGVTGRRALAAAVIAEGLDRDLSRARAFLSLLVTSLPAGGRDAVRVRELVRDLASDVGIAGQLVRGTALPGGVAGGGCGWAGGLGLTRALGRADRLVGLLEAAAVGPVTLPVGPAAGLVRPAGRRWAGWLAWQMAGWSVLLLPAGERGRYREEFKAELLALDGVRRRQVGYAARLLLRSGWLRRELRGGG